MKFVIASEAEGVNVSNYVALGLKYVVDVTSGEIRATEYIIGIISKNSIAISEIFLNVFYRASIVMRPIEAVNGIIIEVGHVAEQIFTF